tara:strand:- start:1567 stop:1842 length:276 start_codon:yes stop_codon:yes gene_type:complete
MRDGACVGENPDMWFPEGDRRKPEVRRQAHHAVTICDTCTVFWECGTWAATNDIKVGVWGGMWIEDKDSRIRFIRRYDKQRRERLRSNGAA